MSGDCFSRVPTQFLPAPAHSGVPNLHVQLRLLLGRRMRRDGLGSAGLMVGLLHPKGLFQPGMAQYSRATHARECSGSSRHSFQTRSLPRLRVGAQPPQGCCFWDWHPVRTGWITRTPQSCHGAQQGDKCSAKHREAKTEDVEGKKNIYIFYLEE